MPPLQPPFKKLPRGRVRSGKGLRALPAVPLELAAIGLESEFTLAVDGRARRPEDVFGDPRAFLEGPLMHREGTSYHLPTGGAVYFDTGVIEVATPVIEIDRGCAARAGRSLWEGIRCVRAGLDAWERRTGRRATLGGFSAHYNVSFDAEGDSARTVEALALLLAHILPAPVMLLATNPRSTGVGVRPRGDRIEVTVDFTPSPALQIATATLITGVVRAVMGWPSYDLGVLEASGLPVIHHFEPKPHTSRQGWLAHVDSYERNPFATGADDPAWALRPAYHARTGDERTHLSLRQIAAVVFGHFRDDVRGISDPFTYRLIRRVLTGRAPSLLDLPDRPAAYDDVGRLCSWDDLFPERILQRSRYERVLIRAIKGDRLRLGGRTYAPVALNGWAEVVFRDDAGGRHAFSIDYLLRHLDAWERGAA